MGVSPLRTPMSKPRRSLALTGTALALMVGLTGLTQPAAAADGRSESPYAYEAPGWGWQRSYPPPPPSYYYYPAPAPAYPYAPPPPGYYHRPPRAAACDSGNVVAGALVGAGVGGIIASQASRGRDNAGATVFGVLAGAVIGGAIGQAADQANGCY